MKKKRFYNLHKNNVKWILFLLTTAILVFSITGCEKKEEKLGTGQSIQNESETVSGAVQSSIDTSIDGTQSGIDANTNLVLTFSDFSTLDFIYSSGVGAWSEEIRIEQDGFFTGLLNDSDMGSSGDGYPNGTRYSSAYTGHVSDIVKKSDSIYEVTLADISYKNTPGTEEYADNVKYVYCTSSFFEGTDVITVYLKGTKVSDIPEDVYGWLSMENESETELTGIAIANLESGIAAFSKQRMKPSEEAELQYSSYNESFEYYEDELKNAMTTEEMVMASDKMYQVSDSLLNKLWLLIKYNVDEARFQVILNEQREWIALKEAKGKELSEQDSGSLGSVDTNLVMSDMTMERCKVLLEYLM